jgi:hypothetical protein
MTKEEIEHTAMWCACAISAIEAGIGSRNAGLIIAGGASFVLLYRYHRLAASADRIEEALRNLERVHGAGVGVPMAAKALMQAIEKEGPVLDALAATKH